MQTADERILPGGTAYITDLGLTGPIDSVIGVDPELAIQRFRTGMPNRFEPAKGPAALPRRRDPDRSGHGPRRRDRAHPAGPSRLTGLPTWR